MSKLYFYHAAMNAGKSSMLLQTNHNYQERGMKTLLFVPDLVAKKTNKIASRVGLEAKAVTFDRAFDLFWQASDKGALLEMDLGAFMQNPNKNEQEKSIELLPPSKDEKGKDPEEESDEPIIDTVYT